MREPTRALSLIVPLVLFTLAGCFRLSRDTPSLEQYVLGGARVSEGTASSPDLAGLAVGVRRLDLSPYLATPAIVVRRGAHGIEMSEFHRWAEDAGAGINRAVAAYVSGQNVRVAVAPWPLRARFDYLIQLHVSRFEGVAPEDSAATEGEAHMQASWEIIRPLDDAVLARGATEYREGGWRVGDYAGLVTLLDSGVEGLARYLVACLGTLVSAASQPGADVEPPPPDRPALLCTPGPEPPGA